MAGAWNYVAGIIERISRTNALYPLLIAFIFSILLPVTVFPFADSEIVKIISLIPALMIAWKVISGFDFFMRNNPEMLRTETHIRQMRALELFGDRDNPLHADADDVASVISNPAAPPALPPSNTTSALPSAQDRHD